jgi:hypothetical protein
MPPLLLPLHRTPNLCARACTAAHVIFERAAVLRHRAFEGWVERGDGSPVFAGDASFMVRPGLTGTPGAISFESCNFPGA